MLPVVLLGSAWWRRGRIAKADWLRTAPFFALALAFGLMTVWFQTRQTLAGFTLPPESFAIKLAGAGMAVWFYLGKVLLPLQLNAIYPRWEIDPRAATAYGSLLLLVATAADEEVRNGAEAVRLAEKARQLTGQREAIMVGALAAAYAEAGQFTNAVVTAQRAITLAQAASNEGFSRMNLQLLQLYRAGRPYHSPPAAPGR